MDRFQCPFDPNCKCHSFQGNRNYPPMNARVRDNIPPKNADKNAAPQEATLHIHHVFHHFASPGSLPANAPDQINVLPPALQNAMRAYINQMQGGAPAENAETAQNQANRRARKRENTVPMERMAAGVPPRRARADDLHENLYRMLIELEEVERQEAEAERQRAQEAANENQEDGQDGIAREVKEEPEEDTAEE